MSTFAIQELIEDAGPALEALPDIAPGFVVPRLADKPQNPIMDTLKRRKGLEVSSRSLFSLPDELQLIALNDLIINMSQADPPLENLWDQSVRYKRPNLSNLLSWDTLRHSSNPRARPSPYLSQQPSYTFASTRYHIRPPLQDAFSQLVYTNAHDLSEALRVCLTGSSSSIHVWESVSETFLLRGVPTGNHGILVITGKDEVVSASLVGRFLTIGTLMRRLENFVSQYRTRKLGPTINAFTHALSTVLSYLHPILSTIPPHLQVNGSDDELAPVAAAWIYYAGIEEILQALATLCRRDKDTNPANYGDLSSNPADILSLVYQHLSDLLDRHAPREVVAIFAYLLSASSRHHLQELCRTVGYQTEHSRPLPRPRTAAELTEGDVLEGHQSEDVVENADEAYERDGSAFPTFIEAGVKKALLRARRSLLLLRVAQPDHPMLSGDVVHPDIEWFWTRKEVEGAWSEQDLSTSHSRPPVPIALYDDNGPNNPQLYPEGMEAFSIFDLPPGGHIPQTQASTLLLDLSTVASLRAFVTSFPTTLPSLTPTLAHLTSLVLSPLARHAASLSHTLVSLYLSPSTPLYFAGHLTLLRSYLLLTSHTFKSRFAQALFSDACEPEGQHDLLLHNSKPLRSGRDAAATSTRWAVGLSSALTEGGVWPPAGANLSFRLRTVIIDSLESCQGEMFRDGNDSHGFAIIRGPGHIAEEAEWRLGFSLRDLPVGTGNEKWLDPMSIESLDFLYMDYKPPRALEVLLTPEVLSKYHRVFAFNLRLMRVESAVHAVYRMSCNQRCPLFPTLTRSNRLLLHFRYVAHTLISSLTSYIVDTAIGGNFDALLSSLAGVGAGDHSSDRLADIFALADRHSHTLDDILSACLLRSGQRAVGDLLRTCLELVLDLAILAGERKLSRVEEYEAASVLEELWDRFRSKMTTLVQVLKALVEKGYGSSRVLAEDVRLRTSPLFQVEGVTGNLRDLLIRLDVSEWWAHAYERRRQRSREATTSPPT